MKQWCSCCYNAETVGCDVCGRERKRERESEKEQATRTKDCSSGSESKLLVEKEKEKMRKNKIMLLQKGLFFEESTVIPVFPGGMSILSPSC